MKHKLVYIGTYTQSGAHHRSCLNPGSEGIYAARVNFETGEMEIVGATNGVENPSFLTIDPVRNRLFCVGEIEQYHGQSSGSITSFEINPQTGNLTLINSQPTGGAGACHIDVDEQGSYVYVANYAGGSIAMFPVEPSGLLKETSHFIQHTGSSANPERQEGPHAHSINLSPNGSHALVPDLGTDKVIVYNIDLKSEKLVADDNATVRAKPGSGPRHLDFHPNGRWVYVINEIISTLTLHEFDAKSGSLTALQTRSTLPVEFSSSSTTADVHVHPSGRHVYGSNRGHDTIAIFEIDPDTGHITALGHQHTMGNTPRNFAIDPSGELLLAANQDTNNIVSFYIDQKTGSLEPTGHEVQVPMPVCIKFY